MEGRFISRECFRDPTEDHVINIRLLQHVIGLAHDNADLDDTQKEALFSKLTAVCNKLACAEIQAKSYERRQAELVTQAKSSPISLQKGDSVVLGFAQQLFFEFDGFVLQVKGSLDRAVRMPGIFVGSERWMFATFPEDTQRMQEAIEAVFGTEPKSSALRAAVSQHQPWLDDLLRLVRDGVESEPFSVYALDKGKAVEVHVPMFSSEQSVGELMKVLWWNAFRFCEDFLCGCLALRLKSGRGLLRLPTSTRSITSPWLVVPTGTPPLGPDAQEGTGIPSDPMPDGLETAFVQASDRPIIGTIFQGKRFRAVHSTLVCRPPEETFHEFTWELLKSVLGKDWYLTEVKKPEGKRHQIVQWYFDLADWQKASSGSLNKTPAGWAAIPSGNVQALVSLAYDVYTLKHANALPPQLLDRVRDYREFQGARYEIAVASIFLRADFDLEYLTGKDKHCEFIATHKQTGTRIGVEAKSRRRAGVLHEKGEVDQIAALRGDIQGLFDDARQQRVAGIPFWIFIDLNCPPETGISLKEKAWFDGVKQCFETYGAVAEGKKDRFTVVTLTNFSTHYFKDEDIETIGESYTFLAKNPEDSLSTELMGVVDLSLKRYGRFPSDPDA